MKAGIRKKLYDEKGSALSFVLIIGVILMLLVASIIAVANSDISFTQESVETRQGYIDAKSVIEFGKVEINTRITALKNIEDQIANAKNKDQLDALKIERAGLITALSPSFSVYGVVDKDITGNLVPDSLSFSPGKYNGVDEKYKGEDRIVLGVCTVTPTTLSSGATKFTFDLKTEKLRRSLNYKVDFDYAEKSVSYWQATTYVPKTMPSAENWVKTNINGNGNSTFVKTENPVYTYQTTNTTLNANDSKISSMSLNVGKDEAGFSWLASKELNLKAQNLYFKDSLPTSVSGAKFSFEAGDIIFPNGLTIGDGETLTLKCNHLWVVGNINLGFQSKLIVIGMSGKDDNQMVVDGSIIKTGLTDGNHLADVNISNLKYFESKGLSIQNGFYIGEGWFRPSRYNDFKISAETMVVKGNITITGNGFSQSMTDIITPVEFTTQYFECTGKTTINNYGNPSTAIVFKAPDLGVLNANFAGGYDQLDAHVDIERASTVVFGTSLKIKSNLQYSGNGIVWSHLFVEGDNIYLEGTSDTSIQMSLESFIYGKRTGIDKVRIYNQRQINYLNGTNISPVIPGSYETKVINYYGYPATGALIKSFLVKRTGDYPANATNGTAEIGVEKYY